MTTEPNTTAAQVTQQPAIRAATAADVPLIREIMDRDWGGEPLIVRGENFYPTQLPGFLAFINLLLHTTFRIKEKVDINT